MTPQVTHHELLLLTHNQFSRNQFGKTKSCDGSRGSVVQLLQHACWNGFVLQLLSDVLGHPSKKESMYTWEVIPAENFIEVRLGDAPHFVEYGRSVNPYFFLFETNFN